MLKRFNAAVQYDDWTGNAAADDADFRDVRKFLREGGWLSEGDFVVAIEVWMGEHHKHREVHPAAVHVYTVPATSLAEAKILLAKDPIAVSDIRIELPIDEFFHLFKRFSIALQWQDCQVIGRDLRGIEA